MWFSFYRKMTTNCQKSKWKFGYTTSEDPWTRRRRQGKRLTQRQRPRAGQHVNFSWVWHTLTGGEWEHTLFTVDWPTCWVTLTGFIRESGLSLWVWRPRSESIPHYICQFPNLINYHLHTLRYQHLVMNGETVYILSALGSRIRLDKTIGLINSWFIGQDPCWTVDDWWRVDSWKLFLINKLK
jgi:hypothetical protein